ncbi:MAG: DNA/RNA non-specific endonuclease [Bacteroidetes bacterium]|nr:DNA/RNA non-specific endonuclease [Bacteroidota bacterium]
MKKNILIVTLLLYTNVIYANNNVNIALGIPIKENDTNYFHIERSQYVLSYNKELNVANWVSYYLCSADFGNVKRYKGNFITDTTLPLDYYRVKHSDYTNSGYDRGHLVRSEERTKTDTDNVATFILTNIIPQTPDLNRKIWLQFENYCKNLCVKEKKHLFINTGGAYYNSKIKEKIGIPDSCWKIVIILDSHQTINDIDSNTQSIAVMMPNTSNLTGKQWTEYITTINNVETVTGYNFFNKIGNKYQQYIENKLYAIPENNTKKGSK